MLPKFGEIPCLGHQLAGDRAAPAPRPMVVIHSVNTDNMSNHPIPVTSSSA